MRGVLPTTLHDRASAAHPVSARSSVTGPNVVLQRTLHLFGDMERTWVRREAAGVDALIWYVYQPRAAATQLVLASAELRLAVLFRVA